MCTCNRLPVPDPFADGLTALHPWVPWQAYTRIHRCWAGALPPDSCAPQRASPPPPIRKIQ